MSQAIVPSTIMAGQAGREWMETFNGRVYLSRVYLNRSGFTPGGVYFGVGRPLYYICAEGEKYNEAGNYYAYDGHIRAENRAEAKSIARELFPNGKIRY
jgi:hypothetical protein